MNDRCCPTCGAQWDYDDAFVEPHPRPTCFCPGLNGDRWHRIDTGNDNWPSVTYQEYLDLSRVRRAEARAQGALEI